MNRAPSPLGCSGCHDRREVAPRPWSGPRAVTLAAGSVVMADDAYLRESLLEPAAKVVAGYAPLMPSYKGTLTREEQDELIAALHALPTVRPDAQPPARPAARAGARAAGTDGAIYFLTETHHPTRSRLAAGRVSGGAQQGLALARLQGGLTLLDRCWQGVYPLVRLAQTGTWVVWCRNDSESEAVRCWSMTSRSE
jgi:hypothetical protein